MPAPPSREQRQIARAMARQLGPAFGLGGREWLAYEPTGDGVTADRGYALAGRWAGFVRRSEPTREAQAGPGVVVGAEQWIAHGDTADLLDEAGAVVVGALLPGYVLVSVAEPGRAYRVGSPVDVAGYVRWLVEPTAAPEPAAPPAFLAGMAVGGLLPLTYGADYGG